MDFIFGLSLVALFLLIIALFVGFPGSPWIDTRKKEKELFKKIIDIPEGSFVYDLGCADASFLSFLHKTYPGIITKGVENFLPAYLVAALRSMKEENMHIMFGNMYRKDYHDADVIYLFLLPEMYPKLLQALREQNLKPEARIIVMAWPFEEIAYQQVFREEESFPIFVYQASDVINSKT